MPLRNDIRLYLYISFIVWELFYFNAICVERSTKQHDSIIKWCIFASLDLVDLANMYVCTNIFSKVVVNIGNKNTCSGTFMFYNRAKVPMWGLMYRGILTMLQVVSVGQYWAWAWDWFPDGAEKPF